MGTSKESDDKDVGGSTIDRELTEVLSDLDQVRIKLDRLRTAARKHSEVRIRVDLPIKTPPSGD